jgi:Cu+-exporting ATPase
MTGMSGGIHVYFEVAIAVTIFLLAGRYFEARAKRRAGDALRALLALGARTATVLRDGEEVVIDTALIKVDSWFGQVKLLQPME